MDVSPAFLYFLSGSIAATGINIITGVLMTSERKLDSLILTTSGIIIARISYILSQLAAIHDYYQRLYLSNTSEILTKTEVEAIKKEIASKCSDKTQQHRRIISLLIFCLFFLLILRESWLFYK